MKLHHASPVLLALFVAGCGFLDRPEITHYSLEPITPAAGVVDIGGTPFGLSAVELPPGLDRQEVAVRAADQRLEVRGTELWAAPLERMVVHTLAFDLAARMPDGMVVLPGQTRPAGGVRSLDVVFEELAAGPDAVLVIDARWTLREPGLEVEVVSHRERISEPLESLASASVASGTSRALARLADRIAARLAAP